MSTRSPPSAQRNSDEAREPSSFGPLRSSAATSRHSNPEADRAGPAKDRASVHVSLTVHHGIKYAIERLSTGETPIVSRFAVTGARWAVDPALVHRLARHFSTVALKSFPRFATRRTALPNRRADATRRRIGRGRGAHSVTDARSRAGSHSADRTGPPKRSDVET